MSPTQIEIENAHEDRPPSGSHAPRDIIDNIPINTFKDTRREGKRMISVSFANNAAEAAADKNDISEDDSDNESSSQAVIATQEAKEQQNAAVDKLIEDLSKSLTIEDNMEHALDPIAVTTQQPSER